MPITRADRLRSNYNRIRVYPYKMGSKGASVLCEGLRGRGMRSLKVYPNGRYNPRRADFLINWGSPRAPEWGSQFTPILNHWSKVALASNKLGTLRALEHHQVSIPPFTEDMDTAWEWYRNGEKVVGRALLNGSSGKGIYLSDTLEYPASEGGMDIAHMSEIQYGIGGGRRPLPLYVKYIKKSAEYRVHVFQGEIIDIQQKRKRRETPNEEVNYQIRSHQNGWVFTREGVHPPDSVRSNALAAVDALGLDFGAVDIIYNQYHDSSYVLEINTAPGLEGTTVDKYVEAIRRSYGY